jgi:DnaJ-class molecular chaperone
MSKCEECNGKGGFEGDFGWEDCPVCDGSGTAYEDDFDDDWFEDPDMEDQ